MNSKKKILLQCQSITYLYMGLAAILTKYSKNDVDIDIFFTKYDVSAEFIEYVKMNKLFKNLFIMNYDAFYKIKNPLNKIMDNKLNKFYYDKIYTKYIAYKYKKQLGNNEYSEIFYSEGSLHIIYANIAYPNAHFVMYGDGSGLIYNPCNSKLIDFYNNTFNDRFYKIKSPNEIISLAPYKKDNSIDISGIPVLATNPEILLDIIKKDTSIQSKVNKYANHIQNEYFNYDKKILILTSRLEDKRFNMSEKHQIDIYIDMINKYANENSLIIIKPHPTSEINLTAILKEKCNCKIIDIPDELKPLPVEIYTNLLKQIDTVITFLSSSKISLKALYGINGLDCYDIIQNYPLKNRVNIDLEVYQKICKKFDNWDKKSIIYECDVLSEYLKFYKKNEEPQTVFIRKNKLIENIFSVRNIIISNKKYKQLTILGVKIKFSQKTHKI